MFNFDSSKFETRIDNYSYVKAVIHLANNPPQRYNPEDLFIVSRVVLSYNDLCNFDDDKIRDWLAVVAERLVFFELEKFPESFCEWLREYIHHACVYFNISENYVMNAHHYSTTPIDNPDPFKVLNFGNPFLSYY